MSETAAELSPEEQAAADRAAFRAAFDEKDDDDDAPAGGAVVTDEPARAEPTRTEPAVRAETQDEPEKPDDEPDLDPHEKRMRSIEARNGTINRELKKLTEVIEGLRNQPTQRQIDAADKSPTAMETLREEFPDWAKAIDERETLLGQRIDASDQRLALIIAQNEELRFRVLASDNADLGDQSIRNKAARLTALVKSESFRAWRNQQSEEVSALVDSDSLDDATQVLDLYRQAHNTRAVETPRPTSREPSAAERLARAVPPTRAKGPTPQRTRELTPHEEFLKAFSE